MKKYKSNVKFLFGYIRETSYLKILKTILKMLGLKYVTYRILSFFLLILLKTKNFFIRGVLFDLQEKITEFVAIKNKYKENFILFAKDNIISKEIFIREEFDTEKLKKVLNYLKPTLNIENLYDIGANIGTICIPAVNRNLVKKAYAVEPEQRNFKLLKINVILNNLEEKISLFNYALSDKDDEIVEMELADDNSGDHRIKKKINFNLHEENKRKVVKIKTKKFDSLFKDINPKKDLIWIDAQGYEANILEGANNLIKSKATIVIEFWPYGLKRNGTWDKMFKFLEKFDYIVDLSCKNLKAEKISDVSLTNLGIGWQKEEKNKHSLFTDLILLQK